MSVRILQNNGMDRCVLRHETGRMTLPVWCFVSVLIMFMIADASTLSTPAGSSEIGDWVWQDLDENGLQDVGEPGFAGIPVLLYDVDMVFIGSVLTDSGGYYSFDGLAAGSYSVEFITPKGYSLTLSKQGSDDMLDSDPDRVTGLAGPVVLADAEINLDIDAGIVVGCDGPGEPVYLYAVDLVTDGCPCYEGCPRLHFADPNHPSTVTGYNIYRSDDPSLPRDSWPLYAHNVVDMDGALPNIQWIDTACDPVEGWYYHIAAWSEICGAEGPYSFSYPGIITSVLPAEGPQSGGTQVVIGGEYLGSGSDIYSVTLCGVSATIIDQTASSVTVISSPTATPGLGDVVVSSVDWGVTTSIDAFTYLDSGLMAGDLYATDAIVGNMRYVPGGTFTQGSPTDEPCREPYDPGSETQFNHTLTRNVAVMETEVTRQMWADLLAVQPSLPADPTNTSYGSGMSNPVNNPTWYETVLFANLLSLQNGLTQCYYKDAGFTDPVMSSNYTSGTFYCNFGANGYRLLSEGEWEYAARAGTTTPFSCNETNYTTGNCDSCTEGTHPVLEQYAVYCANDTGESEWVGSKLANPWNLSDMHGNVWEWCWDWYNATYPGDTTDYTGPGSGSYRVERGGSWFGIARNSRSANRNYYSPGFRYYYFGFRLARSVN
ncbi:SUMF1/EgtB/PvdO family nonheme iron enzyme [bacterium]|nr:SUMF1/EgtB/PvdO family nonheme iron enzyme [bacterium]